MVRRNRASAKKAGTAFETLIARYLATHVDDRIERRRLSGSKDRGDIAGVRTAFGHRVVVECKNTARLALAAWAGEADIARGNDDAQVAVVAHKRHGVGAAGRQWVSMTLDDFVTLISGARPDQP